MSDISLYKNAGMCVRKNDGSTDTLLPTSISPLPQIFTYITKHWLLKQYDLKQDKRKRFIDFVLEDDKEIHINYTVPSKGDDGLQWTKVISNIYTPEPDFDVKDLFITLTTLAFIMVDVDQEATDSITEWCDCYKLAIKDLHELHLKLTEFYTLSTAD